MAKHYHGIIVDDNGKLDRLATFVSFGEMADGTKCYHEVNGDEEITGVWYSRSVRKFDDTTYQFFFAEGVE